MENNIGVYVTNITKNTSLFDTDGIHKYKKGIIIG